MKVNAEMFYFYFCFSRKKTTEFKLRNPEVNSRWPQTQRGQGCDPGEIAQRGEGVLVKLWIGERLSRG